MAIAANADGGTVRLAATSGPYRLTVFSSPQPLRAGPIDLSVLVQEAATSLPADNVQVRFLLTPETASEPTLTCEATRAAATNKFLQAAKFDLPAGGVWQVQVSVTGRNGTTTVGFTMTAAEPLPRWTGLGWWLALPGVVVGLYALQHWLTARQQRRATLAA